MGEELERAFSSTCRLLLGKELAGLEQYGGWLGKAVPLPRETKSALSGKEVWIPPSDIYLKKQFNLKNAISADEIDQANTPPMGAGELEGASVKDILGMIKPISHYCGNFRYWTYTNAEKSSGTGDGRNMLMCDDVYLKVKNVAYGNYVLYSENLFGCHGIMHSGFSIHAHYCTKITRCFEVDACTNSSDLLFCHNCENVHDSMFCFNAKNLRNAIGNVPVAPDEYRRIKELVQQEIVKELGEKKSFRYDIFNVGCP
ncbi:MAG: hypothetical protein ABII71_03460 [Candidatus Micrarchaeota archaeon]